MSAAGATPQYPGVTPITRNLLQHWADPKRENRVIFAQRDAAETAIFLTEVAGRTHGYADWRKRLEPENAAHNGGLPRAALKMATGSGNTVVMAMLIAWQTLNKVQSPRDARFTNRFLVITPEIAKNVGIKQVFDLSATPFYLSGSGYNEGYIFPWTVSDFLGDAPRRRRC
jgi:hypothetical protein